MRSQFYSRLCSRLCSGRGLFSSRLCFGFASSAARRALQARILEAHRPPYFERRRGQAPDSFDPAAADFERQKVPWRLWRLCDANASHSICGSYPASNLVVPAALSDDDVREAAQFRTRQRLPKTRRKA